MAESELNCDKNPLRIVEDEVLSCDRIGDNESTCEMFDFSDVEESESSSSKRNSLLIIEEKDLMMDGTGGDLNNNNRHRLSLQVESGDENSLVMMNEAINRTIIRIGSNASSVDFGEVGGGAVDKPHEAVNRAVNERRGSENFQDNDGEAIVNILGQINDIVGCTRTVNCFVSTRSGAGCCFSLLSVITNKQVGSSTMSHGFFLLFPGGSAIGSEATSTGRGARDSHARTGPATEGTGTSLRHATVGSSVNAAITLNRQQSLVGVARQFDVVPAEQRRLA